MCRNDAIYFLVCIFCIGLILAIPTITSIFIKCFYLLVRITHGPSNYKPAWHWHHVWQYKSSRKYSATLLTLYMDDYCIVNNVMLSYCTAGSTNELVKSELQSSLFSMDTSQSTQSVYRISSQVSHTYHTILMCQFRESPKLLP